MHHLIIQDKKMEELREAYITYQSQFYTDEMYDQIQQSDQNNSIRAGGYDTIIKTKFNITLTPKENA